MFKMTKKIVQYPRVTLPYPRESVDNSHFRARPELSQSQCTRCQACVSVCPSRSIDSGKAGEGLGINYDTCIFCHLCAEVCPVGAITVTGKYEWAETTRQALRHSPADKDWRSVEHRAAEAIGSQIQEKASKLFGRSLQIREVDAGSCNGCDYEINGLNNPFNDLERFGVHFVASPRHADLLMVTGTACRNMELALIKTYNAMADPKLVAAVGACACSGGIFRDSTMNRNGLDTILPVDLYIPGCPPRPITILHGILKLIDRLPNPRSGGDIV